MQYVDLAGIELHKAGPTQRPAAAWIEQDTERARARAKRIAQARAGTSKQLPKNKRHSTTDSPGCPAALPDPEKTYNCSQETNRGTPPSQPLEARNPTEH